jgi:hypothetical protein
MDGREHDAPVVATADPTPEQTVDLTAAKGSEDVLPALVVGQSLGQYLRAWFQRIRSGDSGVLPVMVGIVIVAIVFEIITPENAYLRPSNLVYIFALSTVYMVLATAEIAVLLLGEIAERSHSSWCNRIPGLNGRGGPRSSWHWGAAHSSARSREPLPPG